MEKYIKLKKDGTVSSGSIFKVWAEYETEYACYARDYEGTLLLEKHKVEEVDLWEEVEKEKQMRPEYRQNGEGFTVPKSFFYEVDITPEQRETLMKELEKIPESKLILNENGALREEKTGKGRFDLIPCIPLLHLAKHYEDGAAQHGERNWEKGLDIDQCYNSALRHLVQANYMNAKKDYIPGNEETLAYHLRAAVFNIFAILNEIEVE